MLGYNSLWLLMWYAVGLCIIQYSGISHTQRAAVGYTFPDKWLHEINQIKEQKS